MEDTKERRIQYIRSVCIYRRSLLQICYLNSTSGNSLKQIEAVLIHMSLLILLEITKDT